MATIAVFGTLDTKGDVHRFVAERIRARGHRVLLLDVGTLGYPTVLPDISRGQLLERTGLEESALDTGREQAAAIMGRSAGLVLARMFLEGGLDAAISVGGLCGSKIALAAMRVLPVGVPTVLVTHLDRQWVFGEAGFKDVLHVGCPTEVGRLNRIVRPILARAAGMVCGAVEFGVRSCVSSDPPVVVASRFGLSDLGYERAARVIEDAGFEVVPFTEKGTGGRLMDSVVAGGGVCGVLDLSMTDLADEVVGGVRGCGSRRMEAAAKRAVPTLVSPGGVDTVHFHMDDVPSEFWGRNLVEQGRFVLMRTNAEECRRIAMVVAEKLNRFVGPVTVCLPLRGLSAMGSPGEPFHDPGADFAFFEALENNLRDGVLVRKVYTTSEDAPFAEMCAQALLENIRRRERDHRLLREVGFLRGASDLLLSEAVRMLEVRSYQTGDFVCNRGAPVDAVCIVNQGALEVTLEGRRLRKLGEGAVFGEAEFLTWDFSAFGVRAIEFCEVLRLRRSVVDQLRRRYPALRDLLAQAEAAARSAAGSAAGPLLPGGV